MMPEEEQLQVGMASKWRKLDKHSTASYSCTALYTQQGGLSLFPSSLVTFLIQDQLHLQFQHYLEQTGCCMLSPQIKGQQSSPSSCPLYLLWKMDYLKTQRLVSVFPQTLGSSNLPVFDFLSSTGTTIHLGYHLTQSISPID